ncbi:MAG: sensor histidine kinase [Clostridiales bacterium]|jgi:two-component system sensor histidine kinase YesM|nr:sensor histidine kinase [Clostridiales bacterium]
MNPKKSRRFLSSRAAAFIVFLVFAICFLIGSQAVGFVPSRAARPVFLAGGAAFVCALLCAAYVWLYRPYRETERSLNLFVNGYTPQRVCELRHPPSAGMEGALRKLDAMLNAYDLITAGRKQAQYLALQNQINPHFLYNTLEGIRGEAIDGGLDGVAEMVETLAAFFRYTISGTDQLVTLEDELEHTQNYFMIQRHRYGPRIRLALRFEDGASEWVKKCRLPRITLQPIVENAIVHGLEHKLADGHVTIKIEATEKRLIVTVSDDGAGMGEARLRKIRSGLTAGYFQSSGGDLPERGGIAIVNVNSRIRLMFGEEYGLTIYSTPNLGTDVEITLPLLAGKAPASTAADRAAIGADIADGAGAADGVGV